MKSLLELKTELLQWKFFDEKFIPENLSWMSDKIIQIYAWIDWLFDTKIGLYLTSDLTDKLNGEERLTVTRKSEFFVAPLNFDRKLQFIQDLKLLELGFIEKIKKLQTLKNCFSHPHNEKYYSKLTKLSNDGQELKSEILNLIEIAKTLDQIKKDRGLA